jgi:hypothetical protein
MILVRGESARYLTPGYFSKDGGYVGYNTVIRASVELHPPLMIGNHCRIEPVCEIGPDAVIGDHVIIDRQCEVSECLILPHTYIGHNLEVRRRIVSGSRLIDPEDGSCIDFAEPWLIAGTELPLRFTDLIRSGVQWLLALGMALVLLLPFLVIMPLGRLRGSGRFKRCSFYGSGRRLVEVLEFHPTTRGGFMLRLIHGLSLDRWPQLLLVLRGRLWLCGQPLLRAPEQYAVYQTLQCPFPAVFSFLDTQDADPDPQTAALYYTRVRSLVEDLRMLRDALSRRLIQILTPIA